MQLSYWLEVDSCKLATRLFYTTVNSSRVAAGQMIFEPLYSQWIENARLAAHG